MFTKTAIALAIILATATGALAATKKSNTNPSFDMTLDNGRGCCSGGDAWDQLRQRNGFPSWAQ